MKLLERIKPILSFSVSNSSSHLVAILRLISVSAVGAVLVV